MLYGNLVKIRSSSSSEETDLCQDTQIQAGKKKKAILYNDIMEVNFSIQKGDLVSFGVFYLFVLVELLSRAILIQFRASSFI